MESNQINDTFCTDGGNSGLHCDIKIYAGPNLNYLDGAPIENTFEGRKADGMIVVAGGDSGGPIISPVTGSAGVFAKGIIMASPVSSFVDCSTVNTPVNENSFKCSRIVVFTDLTSDLDTSHMRIY